MGAFDENNSLNTGLMEVLQQSHPIYFCIFFTFIFWNNYRSSLSCQNNTEKSLINCSASYSDMLHNNSGFPKPGSWLARCSELNDRSYSGFTDFCINSFLGLFLLVVLWHFITFKFIHPPQQSGAKLVRPLQAVPSGWPWITLPFPVFP